MTTGQGSTRPPLASPRGPLAIVCGSGDFPIKIAETVSATGRDVLMIGLSGAAEPAIETFPHVWVRFGEIGRMFRALDENGAREIVIVGAVQRPAPKDVRLDWRALASLPELSRLLRGGDDRVLSGVVSFLENHGYAVLGVQDVAPHLLAPLAPLGHGRADERSLADIELGRRVLAALGPFDVGQSIAVADGRVLAVEAAEGTDAMLRRVAELRAQGRIRSEGGVLVKAPKPGQDLRVDLPAIGERTIAHAAEAGLSGIALEAGRVLVTDRSAVGAAADRAGLFVVGYPAGGAADGR